MNPTYHEGGCLCGALRYRAAGEPVWVCHCHCRMCQRQTGAAFATFAGFPAVSLTWVQGEPSLYRSSERVRRGFCGTCGSTMSFHRDDREEVSVLAGTLDHPEHIAPEIHLMTQTRMPWLELADGLPCHAGSWPRDEDRRRM